jgi:energy-converting hydrogenase Eha subunit C
MNYVRLFSIIVILINSFKLFLSSDPIESSIGLILIPVFVIYLKKVVYKLQQ